MAVNAAGSVGATAAPEVADKTKLGKDDFLKLLMTQLTQQDPLSPTDSQAFVAQLAQFSNLELMQNNNQTLQSLLFAQASQTQMNAANLVGKDVVAKTNNIDLKQGAPVEIHATLQEKAASVTAVISDSQGKVVRTIKMSGKAAGDMNFAWDGLNDKGEKLEDGKYSISLTAADEKGASVPIDAKIAHRVTGVSFANGYAELLLGDVRVTMANVVEISDGTSTPVKTP